MSNLLCYTQALTGASTVSGVALAWQQMTAILIKRFHHSRRDWKGLIAQILLPVLFVLCAMGLGSIKNDLRHYPELDLSPALYNFQPSYSFFRSVALTNQHTKEPPKGCNGEIIRGDQCIYTQPARNSSIRALQCRFLIHFQVLFASL